MPVTVYICDDVPELRAVMHSALEASGDIEVIGQAGEAFTAVEEIAEVQPDVVLLDLAMPGMDGLEALARASGADRYVEKGRSLDDLRQMVRELAEEIERN